MRPYTPVVMNTAGHVVQPVDMLTTISNVVTLLAYGNARPGSMLPFTGKSLAAWRRTAVAAANTDDMQEILETLRMDSNASRSPQRYFLQKYQEVAAILTMSQRYVPDVGHNIAEELLQATGQWSRSFVSSPSLGFPRPYLQLSCDVSVGPQPIGLPDWDIGDQKLDFGVVAGTTKKADTTQVALPSPAGASDAPNTLRHALAALTMLIDRPAMSDRLVPDVTSLGARDPKEAHFGIMGAIAQADRLTAMGLLYMLQADAFWTRFTEPLYSAAYDVAYALNPRDRAALEFKRKLRADLLKLVPLHPLLETIANMFGSVSIATRHGVKPVTFRHGPTEEVPVTEPRSSAMLAVGSLRSFLAQTIVADALADYARLQDIARSESWPSTLLGAVAPTLGKEGVNSILRTGTPPVNWRSHGEVIEWLARNAKYVALWPELARNLGWGGAMGAPNIEIQAGGADFVLCDGDFYSSNPLAVLAGLRPSISAANKKIVGITAQSDADWNTGPEPTAVTLKDNNDPTPVSIKWSTLVFAGHMTGTKGPVAQSRFFMPPGMLMGEQGGVSRFVTEGERDPFTLELVNFYRSMSAGGFVRHWYGDPKEKVSRIDDHVAYMCTDWDAWTENTDARKTQEVLLSKYGPENVEGGGARGVDQFMYRDSWKMRVPVKLARTNAYELYNELGELRFVQAYGGGVLFDDYEPFGESVAPIDAVVDMLRVKQPELETPYTGEVEAPSINNP